MVALIEHRRLDYQAHQSVFWRKAARSAAITWWYYGSLLLRRRTVALVVDGGTNSLGFLIARPAPVPPVYAPGGSTYLIDDFCVAAPERWDDVGRALLDAIRAIGRHAGWRQLIVICGTDDAPKAALLRSAPLSPASTWWVGTP